MYCNTITARFLSQNVYSFRVNVHSYHRTNSSWTILKYSVLTSQGTHFFYTVDIDRSMTFKEIIALYSEINMTHLSALCERDSEIFNVKACGKYSKLYSWKIKFKRKLRNTVTCESCLVQFHAIFYKAVFFLKVIQKLSGLY